MDAALARIMCLEGYARSARRLRVMSAHELFCVRNSVWPLQFVAITGNSISIASMNGRPHPSPRDGSTNACAALYSSDICTVSLNSWRRRRRRRRTGPAACAPVRDSHLRYSRLSVIPTYVSRRRRRRRTGTKPPRARRQFRCEFAALWRGGRVGGGEPAHHRGSHAPVLHAAGCSSPVHSSQGTTSATASRQCTERHAPRDGAMLLDMLQYQIFAKAPPWRMQGLGPLPATARGDTRTRGRRPNMQGPSRNPHGRTLSVLEDCMGSTFGWWRRRCCADTGDGPTAARRSLRPRGVTLACYAWAPPHVCVKPSRTNLILDVLAGASKYGVELEDERHARRCTR
jgi:hypothetical protein